MIYQTRVLKLIFLQTSNQKNRFLHQNVETKSNIRSSLKIGYTNNRNYYIWYNKLLPFNAFKLHTIGHIYFLKTDLIFGTTNKVWTRPKNTKQVSCVFVYSCKNYYSLWTGVYAIIQYKSLMTNTTKYILFYLSDNKILLFSLKLYVSQVCNGIIIFDWALSETITVIE